MWLASFILELLKLAIAWIPIRFEIVNEYEQGVRWWKGRATKLLREPGIYCYVPWLGDLTTESCKMSEVETNLQVVEDPYGNVWSVSVGLSIEVDDLLTHEVAVTDFDDSLLNLVERVTCQAIQSLPEGVDDPIPTIRDEVEQRCREWGVKLHHLGLINHARVRPIHLLQND